MARGVQAPAESCW